MLLAPGGVQLYYGDESGRPPGPVPDGDPQQATRSPMNWNSMDTALLEHARRIGQFRNAHPALARGRHVRLNDKPYVFAREDAARDDRVVVVPEAKGEIVVAVRGVFADGERIRDAYSGRESVVRNGMLSIRADGTLLLERPR